MYMFCTAARQRYGVRCSDTRLSPFMTRSTDARYGYVSYSCYRLYRRLGEPSIPTPQTGVRPPAWAPSAIGRSDHPVFLIMGFSQPALGARVIVSVPAHRVIAGLKVRRPGLDSLSVRCRGSRSVPVSRRGHRCLHQKSHSCPDHALP